MPNQRSKDKELLQLWLPSETKKSLLRVSKIKGMTMTEFVLRSIVYAIMHPHILSGK